MKDYLRAQSLCSQEKKKMGFGMENQRGFQRNLRVDLKKADLKVLEREKAQLKAKQRRKEGKAGSGRQQSGSRAVCLFCLFVDTVSRQFSTVQ